MLEAHWERVIKLRTAEEDPHLTDEKSPILDVFGLSAVPKSKEGGDLMHFCTVSAPKPFWDLTLSFYSLFWPELWPTPQKVAETLFSFFPSFKVHPEGVRNFNKLHWDYLENVISGKEKVLFLEMPIEVAVALRVVSFTNYLDMREKKTKKHAFNIREAKIKELTPWEDEWEEVKRKE